MNSLFIVAEQVSFSLPKGVCVSASQPWTALWPRGGHSRTLIHTARMACAGGWRGCPAQGVALLTQGHASAWAWRRAAC